MEITDFLSNNVPLFSGFPAEVLEKIVDESSVISFEPNEAVIEFGETGHFLGLLVEGEAELSIADESGKRYRLGLVKPGEVFGALSLMTGDKTNSDVIGITRCKALLVQQHVFSTLLASYQSAVEYLSGLIAEQMKQYAADRRWQEIATSWVMRSGDPYNLELKSSTPMKILVFDFSPPVTSLSGNTAENPPSVFSYYFFDTTDSRKTARGKIEGINEEKTIHTYYIDGEILSSQVQGRGLDSALKAMESELLNPQTGVIKTLAEITVVGHKVMFGGEKYINSTLVDDAVIGELEALVYISPGQLQSNITGIRTALKLFPSIPHVAVFDTSFHHTLPPYAYLYGLPYEYYSGKKIRRYGYSGIIHSYTALKAAEYLHKKYNSLEIITCFLDDDDASICGVDHGRSVDISQGFTPFEGLMTQSQCGIADPGLLLHLLKSQGMDYDKTENMLVNESGLRGISGIRGDFAEIRRKADEGDHQAILAIKTFSYQVRKYIGAYMAAMGGLDVLVFAGATGENSATIRGIACQGLGCMGVVIDEKANHAESDRREVYEISSPHSQVKVLVIHPDEARMIARETLKTLEAGYISRIIDIRKNEIIPVEVSAHHIHLSREHMDILFGKDYQFTILAELSQPGQYAYRETVNLIGPKGTVSNVRILGPERRETQIEIAMTEQYKLGVQPPIRESGDLNGTPGIIVEGAQGKITIDKGVICALRHIHMTPADALRFGLHDTDIVRVRIDGDRELIFGDVLVRVSPKYKLAMHIDTDEANAANIKTGMNGYIEGIQSTR